MYKSSNLIRRGFECYMCPLQRVNSNECQQSLVSHVNVKHLIQNRKMKLDLLLHIILKKAKSVNNWTSGVSRQCVSSSWTNMNFWRVYFSLTSCALCCARHALVSWDVLPWAVLWLMRNRYCQLTLLSCRLNGETLFFAVLSSRIASVFITIKHLLTQHHNI